MVSTENQPASHPAQPSPTQLRQLEMLKKKKKYTEIRALETVGGVEQGGRKKQLHFLKCSQQQRSWKPGFPIGILNCKLIVFTNFYILLFVILHF